MITHKQISDMIVSHFTFDGLLDSPEREAEGRKVADEIATVALDPNGELNEELTAIANAHRFNAFHSRTTGDTIVLLGDVAVLPDGSTSSREEAIERYGLPDSQDAGARQLAELLAALFGNVN